MSIHCLSATYPPSIQLPIHCLSTDHPLPIQQQSTGRPLPIQAALLITHPPPIHDPSTAHPEYSQCFFLSCVCVKRPLGTSKDKCNVSRILSKIFEQVDVEIGKSSRGAILAFLAAAALKRSLAGFWLPTFPFPAILRDSPLVGIGTDLCSSVTVALPELGDASSQRSTGDDKTSSCREHSVIIPH